MPSEPPACRPSPPPCVQTRRNRPNFSGRFRSARESDLRASSPPFGGHYVVELRVDASLLNAPGLHRSHSDLSASASFSPLARRRCRRRVHIIRAPPYTAQYPNAPKRRFSTRTFTFPRCSAAFHAFHMHRCIRATREKRRGRPGFPVRPRQRENRSARVLADSSSAKTASNSPRCLVASAPVSFSRAHPPSSPPAWTHHSSTRGAAQGVQAGSLRSLTNPELSTVFANRSRCHPPRYAATTSRCVASSAPVPVRTIRPRSMT